MLSRDEFLEWALSASSEELQDIDPVQFKTTWNVPMKQIKVPKKYAFALRKLALDLYEAELKFLRVKQENLRKRLKNLP